jgi:microcystin-dependent protein
MSQHDFDIATADANTGLTMRAAINAALQALASSSLGLTAPGTTYPGQFWADTTSGFMKIRNSGNTAWVQLFPLAVAFSSAALANAVAIRNASGLLVGDITGNAATATNATNAGNADALDGQHGSWYSPPGMFGYHGGSSPPAGWLKRNGAAVSRTVYANLFAAIGTTWGAGDGSTTFNLPDSRGEFDRAWDDSRGVDSGRAFGSFQADDFKSHSHNLSSSGITGSYAKYWDHCTAGAQYPTDAAGGTETRPRNIASLAIIKY